MSGAGTVVVTQDAELLEAVRRALSGEPSLEPVTASASLLELSSTLSRVGGSLVLVDVGGSPADVLATLRGVVDDHASSRFVVIAPDFNKDHLLLAMQAGARHFMPRDWVNEAMRPLCRELMEQIRRPSGEAMPRGELVLVLSSGGGCGATTVAVNLASEAAGAAGVKSLVVDLDVRYGGAASHLGLKGRYGIADVLERGEGLDAGLVGSTSVPGGERLDVLLSPATVDFDEPAPLRAEHFDTAASVFRDAYAWTVVDAPSLTAEAQAGLAGLATRVVLVLGLSIKDLGVARATLASLRKRGVETPVTVAANRAGMKGAGVTLADAKGALEHAGEVVTLPEDPAAMRSLNAGRTLADAAGKSKLRRSIAALAASLREGEGRAAA